VNEDVYIKGDKKSYVLEPFRIFCFALYTYAIYTL